MWFAMTGGIVLFGLKLPLLERLCLNKAYKQKITQRLLREIRCFI